jgi:hypothetical protein
MNYYCRNVSPTNQIVLDYISSSDLRLSGGGYGEFKIGKGNNEDVVFIGSLFLYSHVVRK